MNGSPRKKSRIEGKPYDPRKLERLGKYLKRRGVLLKMNDTPVPGDAWGAFAIDGTELLLQNNPTEYEVWHELGHFLHCRKVGREAYAKLPRSRRFNAPEQFVFDLLESSPKRWSAMSFEQQQHAIDYIEQNGGFR